MPFIVSAFGIIISVLLTLVLGNVQDMKRGLEKVVTQVNTHETNVAVLVNEVKSAHVRITRHEEAHA